MLDIGSGPFPFNSPPFVEDWFIVPFKVKNTQVTVSAEVLGRNEYVGRAIEASEAARTKTSNTRRGNHTAFSKRRDIFL